MNWSDLQPRARAAILAAAFVVALVLLWSLFVSPMRARAAAARTDLATAESQLEQIEREIESIPPATDAERRAWQGSIDELQSRLGPEAELPLFIESLVRLGDAQQVDVFITSEEATAVGEEAGVPAAVRRVIGSIPGARFVPLKVRAYGDYAATGRFVSQIGRLGWVTDIAALSMTRNFPEVTTEMRLVVFFRPSDTEGEAGGVAARAATGTGGRSDG